MADDDGPGDSDGPANSGGAVQFAAVDTEDRPGLSTTADFGKDENTRVTLDADAIANRHGYTSCPLYKSDPSQHKNS